MNELNAKNETNFNSFKKLCSCRFQFQNPATFQKTFLYITRTDIEKFRIKIFESGKLIKKQDIKAKSFAEIIENIKL